MSDQLSPKEKRYIDQYMRRMFRPRGSSGSFNFAILFILAIVYLVVGFVVSAKGECLATSVIQGEWEMAGECGQGIVTWPLLFLGSDNPFSIPVPGKEENNKGSQVGDYLPIE